MPPRISNQACVDPNATIANDVEIGPFCYVGPHVSVGRGTVLRNNVTLTGHTSIGEYNQIFQNVVIGEEPQDVSYDGQDTQVVIGDHNVLRECVTINRASTKEDGITAVGSHCYFMACSHIAHDCKLGDRIVIANGTILGGHVNVQDFATISGNVGVHHFASIGSYSFVAGCSRVLQDVPPYMLVDGIPAKPRCVNVVALKRNDFQPSVIRKISEAHRLLYRARVGLENTREIMRNKDMLCKEVHLLFNYVANQQAGQHGRGREQIRRAA